MAFSQERRSNRGGGEASVLPLRDPLLQRSVGDGDLHASHDLDRRRHPFNLPRATHSMPLGSNQVDVRAVAHKGFEPLREAYAVLIAWGALCVVYLVLVLLPSSDDDGKGSRHLGPFEDSRVRVSLNTALLLASGALELVLRAILKRRQSRGYLSFYRGVRKLLPQPFRIVACGTAALLIVVTLSPGADDASGCGGGVGGERGGRLGANLEPTPYAPLSPAGHPHPRGAASVAVQVIVSLQCLSVIGVLAIIVKCVWQHNLRAPRPDAQAALTSAMYGGAEDDEEEDDSCREDEREGYCVDESFQSGEGEWEDSNQGRQWGGGGWGSLNVQGESEVVSEQQAEFNRYLCEQVRELGREVLRLQGRLQFRAAAGGGCRGPGVAAGAGFGLGSRLWRSSSYGVNGALRGVTGIEEDIDEEDDEGARRRVHEPKDAFSLEAHRASAMGSSDTRLAMEARESEATQLAAVASMQSELRATRMELAGREGEVRRLRAANHQHEEEVARLRVMLEEWSGQAAQLEARLEETTRGGRKP